MVLPILKKHRISFSYAWEGLVYVVRSQPNFRVHLAASLLTIVCALVFRVSVLEWLALTIAMSLVLVAELFNTAVEAVVDLLTGERKVHAKIAKDVAAGAVLATALLAVVIGLVVFVPKLLRWF